MNVINHHCLLLAAKHADILLVNNFRMINESLGRTEQPGKDSWSLHMYLYNFIHLDGF